jgi:hypothetical protein
MVASPVSPRVGNVKNNDASLIEPARIGHTLNLELMAAEAVTPARRIAPILAESSGSPAAARLACRLRIPALRPFSIELPACRI